MQNPSYPDNPQNQPMGSQDPAYQPDMLPEQQMGPARAGNVPDMPTIGQGQSYAQPAGQPVAGQQGMGQGLGQGLGQGAGDIQQVVGDERNAHQHPAVTHTHDHYHVSHHHRHGEVLGSFEHRAHYHSHEHNHASITHAHQGRDPETERREHDEMAHTHDHTDPTGQNLMS
jgi:hypothetical protein